MKREKREIAYSIGILIAIPAIVITNTIILTRSTSEAFDTELQRKADLVNSVIAESSLPLIQNKQYKALQSSIDALESSQPSLKQSYVIVKDGDVLKVVAHSSSTSEKLDQTAIINAEFALNLMQPSAHFINTYDSNNNPAQAWNVMTPVIDQSSKKAVAVVSTTLLTVDAQEAIDSAYRLSFIILLISIVLIIVLLFRHFMMVNYIVLLAKQRELNQTMNDFLSVATHELKAPTTIIKGYLSNVVEGDFGAITPEIKEQIEIALSQTDRLNALVQDLLNVSRVEQGSIQYNLTVVNTEKVLGMIVENYRPIAAEKGLQLIYEPTGNLPFVKADEGRVQEIFTNLVDNAIKYTATGSVTVTQQLNKGKLVTNFRDTGFGISPAAKERLFQRFYRIKTTQTEGISGTGLGLWIIKQYVEAMKGKIDVESMEGVGSNFIVELQVASPNNSSVVTKDSNQVSPNNQ
jgi:signal transduction histidine kinase